MLESSARS